MLLNYYLAVQFSNKNNKTKNLACIKMRSALSTVQPLSTDTSLIWTPLYHRRFPMSRQNSHIFAIKKKTSIIWTLSNTDNGH